MSAAPASTGRNLLGVAALCGFLVLLYLALSEGATHTWFVQHPGVLGAALVGLGIAAAVAFFSGQGKIALVVALVVFGLAYGVPDVRSNVVKGERPILASQGSGSR